MARQLPSRSRPAPSRSRPAPPHPGVFRRRRAAAAIVVLLVLAGIAIGVRALIYDSGLARVGQVEVTGVSTLPVDKVIATAAVPLGGPLAAVDTAAVAQRVATLPPVASVEVARSWPHTVSVEVRERVPVGIAQRPDGLQLVDDTGAVYVPTVPVDPASVALPRFTFPSVGTDDPATRSAVTALAAFPPQLRPQLRTVDVTGASPASSGQVVFGLTDDRQVRWGNPDRGPEKAAVLRTLLTQPGTIFDVASPELPTIRR